jgi:hypothetical protein
VLEAEAVTVVDGLRTGCAVNEKGRVVNEMFLVKLDKEHFDQRRYPCRKQPHVKEVDRGEINSIV